MQVGGSWSREESRGKTRAFAYRVSSVNLLIPYVRMHVSHCGFECIFIPLLPLVPLLHRTQRQTHMYTHTRDKQVGQPGHTCQSCGSMVQICSYPLAFLPGTCLRLRLPLPLPSPYCLSPSLSLLLSLPLFLFSSVLDSDQSSDQ